MKSRYRSLIKAMTYRVLGTLVSMIGLWIVGGNLKSVFTVGICETILKIGIYYAHERAWSRIDVVRV